MTPELKTACEVVFQEHKLSGQPVKWDRDAFRGRISIGLCEMAKETLVKKHIIILPKKSRKVVTQLNPQVAAAGSFEEAEKMIDGKTESPVNVTVHEIVPKVVNGVNHTAARNGSSRALAPVSLPATHVIRPKWWLKPLFLYFVWPLCGAAAGVALSFLMNIVYKVLFFHPK